MRLKWALLGVVIVAAPVSARERVALVIANSAYQNVAKLKNPNADGALVADALRRSGFTSVEVVRDLDKAGMDAALQRFGNKADSAEIAMVYFAGHGIETSGRNYLIPVSAKLLRDRDAEFEAVALDSVLRVTEGARMRVIILDACRENPFDSSMARTSGSRSVSRGLSRVEPEGNTLIAYAAKAGSLAADGGGANSPFATALAKRLVEPGVEVRLLFGKVRDDVLAATGRQQEPFTYGSLSGTEFYFVPRAEAVGGGGNSPAIEPLLWQSAMQLGTAESYQDYLNRFPNGVFAGQAKQNLARLAKVAQAAVATVVAGATGNGAGPERWGLTPAEMSVLLGSDILKKSNFAGRVTEVETAAKGGDATAAYLVGAGYFNGVGYAKDLTAAQQWFIKSAEAGSARGARAAGVGFHNGEGVAKNPAQAIPWYERAIKGGDGGAMGNLAILHENGMGGLPVDFAKAAKFYRDAANAGDIASMRNLGRMIFHGRGVPVDKVEGMRWFRLAADRGDAEAMNWVGYAAETGIGATKDYAEALRWYRASADAGNATAMANLALAYREGRGVAANDAEALVWFRKAAAAGNTIGMVNVGFFYDQGRAGLTRDYAEAARWYRQAAEAGNAEAMQNLADMYRTGQGVTADPTEALRWYERAANAGNAQAMFRAGIAHRDGAGTAINLIAAFNWFGKSAKAGYRNAYVPYGYAYNNGRGTTVNQAEALRWYRAAADAGDRAGMHNMGEMYKNGYGVTRNPAIAAWWYKKALDAGYATSKGDYDALIAAGITPRPE